VQAISDQAAFATHALEARICDVRVGRCRRFGFETLYGHGDNLVSKAEETSDYGGVNVPAEQNMDHF
jgi:hypothetical protein